MFGVKEGDKQESRRNRQQALRNLENCFTSQIVGFLGCNAMNFRESPMIQRNM
jgi:hypothetical protein